MLETIREFALEQLRRSGELGSVAARHAEYFAALADRGVPAWSVANDDAEWVGILGLEHDNLRAALEYSEASPVQLRLACALWRFWVGRADYAEGRRWLERALANRAGAPQRDVSTALRAAGEFARLQGDLDRADQLTEESISIAARAGDRVGEMHGRSTLAMVAKARGDHRRTDERILEVEALARELGDEYATAVMIQWRASLALETSDFELAHVLAQEAAETSRKSGHHAVVVFALLVRAVAAHALGESPAATSALVEAIEGARRLGLRAALVQGLIVAAAVIVERDPIAAAHLLAAADRALTELAIELDPVERHLRAATETQLPTDIAVSDPLGSATQDLDGVLEAAATRALETLTARDPDVSCQ